MTASTCEFLARFITDPNGLKEQARAQQADLLGHFAECVECQARIDEIGDENAGMLFEILAAEETESSSGEDLRLDKIMQADAKREQSIRDAVQFSLIPSFLRMSAAGKIAKNFDPLALYSSTEAVSMLIRRYVRLNHHQSVANLELKADGSLWANEREAISAKEMATEIARFANLWEPDETGASPTRSVSQISQGLQLAEWTFLAAHERPNLLRDFRASIAPSDYAATFGLQRVLKMIPTGIVKPQTPLWLIPLSATDRIDDLNERWRPSAADLPFIYCIPKKKGQPFLNPIPMLQFTTKEFSGLCSSYRSTSQPQVTAHAFSEMTFFLMDTQLAVEQPGVLQVAEVFVDSGHKASCTMIGTFKDVLFEEKCELKLVDVNGTRTTKYVQRLDVPIHMSFWSLP